MHLSSGYVIIDATDDDCQTPIVTTRAFKMFLGVELFRRETYFYSPSRRDSFRKRLSFVSPNFREAEIAAWNVTGFDDVWIDNQHLCGFVLLLLQFEDQSGQSRHDKRTCSTSTDDNEPKGAVFDWHYDSGLREAKIDFHHNTI